jgi:membrane protease subunit (stomatin/prohibitin family)
MGQPSIRPQGHLRPLPPANSTRSQAADPTIGHSMKRMPNNLAVHVIPSQQQQHQQQHHHQQQQQSSLHTNMNGKCIVCSKFALYLCSNCQQFWYCSPQCQVSACFLSRISQRFMKFYIHNFKTCLSMWCLSVCFCLCIQDVNMYLCLDFFRHNFNYCLSINS